MPTLHLQAATENSMNLPNDLAEVHAPLTDHVEKLAKFEAQLSDVCDFANKSVPMLCETMQRNEEALLKLNEAYNGYVDAQAKAQMDMSVKIDEEFEKRDTQINTILGHYSSTADAISAMGQNTQAAILGQLADKQGKIDELAEKIAQYEQRFESLLDMHAVQLSELEVRFKAHRFSILIGVALLGAAVGPLLYKVFAL